MGLPSRIANLPAQQNGKFERSAIATSEEADLRVIWEMIQDEHAIRGHGVRAAAEVLLLQKALPLSLQEVIQELSNNLIWGVVKVTHALHATLSGTRGKVSTNLHRSPH